MANYSIALGVQPPQIDTGNALALAAQLQRQKAAEQQAQQGMELERERFGLQKQQFQSAQAAQQAQLQAQQAQQNALAEYTKAQQGGDENALSRLSAYPELQQRVLQVRNQMAEAERGEFDQKLIRNARRAQSVMGLQGEAKQQAWMGALDDAVQSGDISPEMYEQYAAQQPNDLMLQNIVEQAVPIQQLYQAPTPQMQELEAAGIEPGTPEFRERIAPAPLPKFEKVGNRLVRINPDGSTVDATPESITQEQGVFETPKDRVEFEQKLRKEYTQASSTFQEVRDAAARVEASAQNASAAGDLALIFNYMKILDPGSVVREGEFATAAASGSYGERMQGLVNRVMTGQRLTEEIRQDFLTRARQLYDAQSNQFGKLTDQYKSIAGSAGLEPEGVILDYTPAPGNFPELDAAGGGGSASGRPRATNPQTGEVIEFNEQTGQWEPVQ